MTELHNSLTSHYQAKGFSLADAQEKATATLPFLVALAANAPKIIAAVTVIAKDAGPILADLKGLYALITSTPAPPSGPTVQP